MAAQTYRDNPRFSTEEAIREVGTGEAVTSLLENKGIPGMVERTLVRPPSSQVGPIDAALRAQLVAASPLRGKYDTLIDRDSAFERLRAKSQAAAQEAAAATAAAERDKLNQIESERDLRNARRYDGNTTARPRSTSSRSDSIGETLVKSFARQLGSRTGQAIVRGVLGSLFKSR